MGAKPQILSTFLLHFDKQTFVQTIFWKKKDKKVFFLVLGLDQVQLASLLLFSCAAHLLLVLVCSPRPGIFLPIWAPPLLVLQAVAQHSKVVVTFSLETDSFAEEVETWCKYFCPSSFFSFFYFQKVLLHHLTVSGGKKILPE